MGDRTYSFDVNLQLSDGAAAQTSSGYSQVGGATAQLDLGGNQATGAVNVAGRIDAMVVIFLIAGTFSTSDVYRFTVCGSNDPAFAAGNVQNFASIDFGIAASRDGLNAMTTAAPLGTGYYPKDSMYELPFTNEQNNVKYEFLQMYVTATTSIQYTAYVAVLPEP